MIPSRPSFAIFAALGYREYRLFWLAGACSNLGMWALIFGRLWLMQTLTGSPVMLGLVTVSSLGPTLLLAVWGGVVADRVDRLRLVIATRSGFAALTLLTGALIATGWIQPWQVIAISLGTGILLSFDIPSRQAMLPGLVDRSRLHNAIALYSFLTAGAAVIGPGIFAPLVNLGGLEGLFLLIGAAYVVTVALLLRMKPLPVLPRRPDRSLWRELGQGLAYIRGQRAILGLIGMGVSTGIFAMSVETLLPVFAENILGGGVDTYSWLLLALGLGALVGTVVLAGMGNLKNSVRILTVTGGGFGAALVGFANADRLLLALFLMALMGAASVAFLTTNQVLAQSLTAEEFRGRVMSVHQLAWGSTALGGVLMGVLAQAVNAPFAVTLGGLVTGLAVVALVWLTLRGVRLETSEVSLEQPDPVSDG